MDKKTFVCETTKEVILKLVASNPGWARANAKKVTDFGNEMAKGLAEAYDNNLEKRKIGAITAK